MSENQLIEVPDQAEKTLSAFFTQMAAEIGEAHKAILNELARSLAGRGWVQPIDAVLAKLAERSSADNFSAALADLERRRLVYLDRGNNKFTGVLGCICLGPTDHRGQLSTGIDVFTFGGMDLLTLPALLLKEVTAFTKCPMTGDHIELKLEAGQIVETNLSGIAGFIANWDGKSSLEQLAANSPLFSSDEALEKWMAANPDITGTELPADLMLWVGMSAAQALAEVRFALIGRTE